MSSLNHTPARRLDRLSRMREFEVAPHEPDPRGWTVCNHDGRAIGEVKDVMVDTDRMAGTYLDIELDTKLFDLRNDDPRILVPIERAHRNGRRIVVDEIGSTWVADLRTERQLHWQEFWERWWHGGSAGREVRGLHISKRVAPEEINRVLDDLRPGESARIPLVEEEIVIERRPISTTAPREDYETFDRELNGPLTGPR